MSDAAPRSLRDFTGIGYDKGRGRLWQALWFATQHLVFGMWFFPARLRPWLLRLFGAKIGQRVYIRHGVRIHWPWKLTVGDDTWIGEGAWLLNLEPIVVGHDVCISQEALVCTGGHDPRSPSFEFDNAPILIKSHAWLCARSIVLRGVTVGTGAIVGAGAVVAQDVEPWRTHAGTPR